MIKGMSPRKQMIKREVKLSRFPRPAITFINQNLKQPGPGGLVGAEIGVFQGKNAESMFRALNIKKLYLIDPYINYKENIHHLHQDLSKYFKQAYERLIPFRNKLVWVDKKSADAVSYVPNNLDFVYIDGNHTYDFVKKDILLYYPKIRKGGVLAGHDYFLNSIVIKNKEVGEVGVKKAVDEFVQKNKLKLYTRAPDWWIVK